MKEVITNNEDSEKKKLEKSEKEYLYLDVKENLSKELKFNKYEYFVENFNQKEANKK